MTTLNPFHRHDIALLVFVEGRRDRAGPERMLPTMELLRCTRQIQEANAQIGHGVSPERLQRRLANGLSFAAFSINGHAIASTWLASGGRYVDEVNWWFPIGPDELWLRDVFVAPAFRGRRLFADMVLAVAHRGDAPNRRVWSDVDWIDARSMRAHELAGFRIAARVRALDFMGRIRLRSALPAWPLPVTEIDPKSRWIWLHGSRLQRHLELLA